MTYYLTYELLDYWGPCFGPTVRLHNNGSRTIVVILKRCKLTLPPGTEAFVALCEC